MTTSITPLQSWRQSFKSFLQPRVITMLFLGFSAGIPGLLIFSSLSLWLGEAGIERKTITFFSWAALSYSFKFLWAPLIDKLPLPFLTKSLGKRRSWMLVTQVFIIAAIIFMGSIDPSESNRLVLMALAAALLGISSASQDVVIDAYRIESSSVELQAMMSSFYITGYRLANIVAGAGALYLATWFGSEKGEYVYTAWRWTYFIMAASMLVGVITTFIIKEPEHKKSNSPVYSNLDYLRLVLVFVATTFCFIATFIITIDLFIWIKIALGDTVIIAFYFEVVHFLLSLGIALLIGWALINVGAINRVMAYETWIDPINDFFNRYGLKTALLLLALIGLYRITDIIPGIISNVFYQDLGFKKTEIATAVKTIGVLISIVGGFLGGLFATHYGVMKTLMLGAILTAFTNLVFVWLAMVGHDIPVMYIAVTADNLAAGFASAAFVAFLSSLTNISFTAVQYAIFSSMMTLLPKTIGGYSGTIVDSIGYAGFFTFSTLIGIPIIWLVWWAGKHLK